MLDKSDFMPNNAPCIIILSNHYTAKAPFIFKSDEEFFPKKILWQIFGGDKGSVDPYCFQVKIRCEHRPTKPQ